MEKIDLIGERFGRLTVIGEAEPYIYIDKKGERHKYRVFTCRCDCGAVKDIRYSTLQHGAQSCGCLARENSAKRSYRHGGYGERLYYVWSTMKARCHNSNHQFYALYGGRGIKVCDEWLGEDGYMNFRKWAYENGYDENAKTHHCTIDRINVNGDYCPENCRWVDQKVQCNNKRTNHILELNGERHTLTEWGEITGLGASLLLDRARLGWSDERMLTTPVRGSK